MLRREEAQDLIHSSLIILIQSARRMSAGPADETFICPKSRVQLAACCVPYRPKPDREDRHRPHLNCIFFAARIATVKTSALPDAAREIDIILASKESAVEPDSLGYLVIAR